MLKQFSLINKHIKNTKRCNHYFRNITFTTNIQPQFPQTLNSISSNPLYSLLGLCKNLNSLKILHSLFIVHGLIGNNLLCDTKLVSMYGSFGSVAYARSVFDRIPSPDFYAWKVMIRWYFLNDEYDQIVGLYNQMKGCVDEVCDDVVVSVVLKACSELRDVGVGRKVHCGIVKGGSFDGFVLTGLVDMYAKCGEVEMARMVFDEIVDRNVVSWTSMIVGYVQNDFPAEGLVLFNRMREGFVEGNQYTVGSLVTACSRLRALHQGKWVHGYMVKSGIEIISFLVTAFLDMYVKCGSIRDACSVFYEHCMFDLVSWTAMIVGYTQSGYCIEALKLFTDKRWANLLPNDVTTASVLSACAQLGNVSLGRSVHGLGIKLGLVGHSTVNNALVDMYGKCHLIGDAEYAFETSVKKDVITWNSMIAGFSENGSVHKALSLFCRMRLDFPFPDAVTIVTVLSACASLGAYGVGCSLHAYAVKVGLISSNVYVGTALLNFYAKCGDAESARSVFDAMGEKNTVTWSAMIGGYGMQGDGGMSLALFSDLLKQLKPNEVVFTTILSACSHAGKVEEGWRCFNMMSQGCYFVPSMKHYACMVDLLARAGRLEEALSFIDKMPIKPDVSVFGAFLHGCELYSRIDIGEVAIRKMLELHPGDACYYVLISNLYASDGRWSQVDWIRKLMKQRKLNKSPGRSQVELEILTTSLELHRAGRSTDTQVSNKLRSSSTDERNFLLELEAHKKGTGICYRMEYLTLGIPCHYFSSIQA